MRCERLSCLRYDLAVVGGTWTAVTRDGEGRILCGDTPDALDHAIRAHWQIMQ